VNVQRAAASTRLSLACPLQRKRQRAARLDLRIKHDGSRIMAYRGGRRVRLITRNGHDLADRFNLAADALEACPSALA